MRPVRLLCLLCVAACAKLGGPAAPALPSGALDQAIGAAIGDPATCVVLADRVSGRILYRYGDIFNCQRPLLACDRPGTLNAETALPFAASGRHASCPSTPDGSRSVGWAQGRVTSAKRDLIYSAVMEGQRALPGIEMAARLDDAFQQAGL